ncbi:MAG TPA: hypothetical protein VIU61_09220 [Kofleriaceae bacterium]
MTRRLGYLDGIGATLAVLSLLVLLAFAVSGGELATMYRDLSGRPATLTTLVLHPAWRFGAPALVLAGIVIGHLRVTKLGLLAVGLGAGILAAITYAAAYAPVMALAGNIKG